MCVITFQISNKMPNFNSKYSNIFWEGTQPSPQTGRGTPLPGPHPLGAFGASTHLAPSALDQAPKSKNQTSPMTHSVPFQIACKSVHFRRCYSQTREHRHIMPWSESNIRLKPSFEPINKSQLVRAPQKSSMFFFVLYVHVTVALARSSSGGVTKSQGKWAISGVFCRIQKHWQSSLQPLLQLQRRFCVRRKRSFNHQ